MSESPRKRQRISADVYQATDIDREDPSTDLANPTTPTRRASYLSPTKASLARSHPDILAKSPQRGSRTEPRGKLLREELLGSRKSTDASLTAPKTLPRLPLNAQNWQAEGDLVNFTERDGSAETIPQHSGHVNLLRPKATEANTPVMRSPLRARQPSSVTTHEDDQARKMVSIAMPVPKLVRKQDAPPREQSETRNEPDLPPTPIQLGIGTMPDRPRGLASSGSMGSKTGSGKHRRRVRGGDRRAITSSPLKPKNTRPLSPTDFSDLDDIDREAVREALESDDENVEAPQQDGSDNANDEEVEDVLPDDFRQKEAQLSALRLELEKLKQDLARDENLADRLQQASDSNIAETASELLKSFGASATNENLEPFELDLNSVKDTATHLALFAPGDLQLEHETTARGVNKRPKIIHKLAFSAPAPWLPSALRLSLDVEIDTEDASIDRVTVAPPTNTREYGNFHHWIAGRFRSPLHNRDVSGIVWGAGRYFEACIQRARVFNYLDQRYNLGVSVDAFSAEKKRGAYTSTDVVALSKYLHRPQLLISTSKQDESSSHGISRADPMLRRILLCYEIDITWTGETTNRIDINFTGINAKSQKDLKELFAKLLPTQGVVGALESVHDVVDNGMRPSEDVTINEQSGSVRT